jgi:hypothetical protein
MLSEIDKLTSIEKRSAAGAAFLVPDMRLMPIDHSHHHTAASGATVVVELIGLLAKNS